MNRIILLLGAVFALLPFATPKAHSQSAPPKFRWQELTAAGGIADGRFQSQFIVPLDLRDDGSWFAVIYHADSAPNYVVVKGDRVTDVPFTGDGALYQMNASGDACGWEYTDPEETVASGVLRDRDGRLTAFAPPQGFPYAILNGISNNGQLVGQAYDEDFNSYAVRSRWTQSTPTSRQSITMEPSPAHSTTWTSIFPHSYGTPLVFTSSQRPT